MQDDGGYAGRQTRMDMPELQGGTSPSDCSLSPGKFGALNVNGNGSSFRVPAPTTNLVIDFGQFGAGAGTRKPFRFPFTVNIAHTY